MGKQTILLLLRTFVTWRRDDQPDFFGDELSRLRAEAVDRPQKLIFGFDGKNREETVAGLLHRVAVAQLPISRVRSDILKDQVLTGVGDYACHSLPTTKPSWK